MLVLKDENRPLILQVTLYSKAKPCFQSNYIHYNARTVYEYLHLGFKLVVIEQAIITAVFFLNDRIA